MKYHLTPNIMASIKKKEKRKKSSISKDAEKIIYLSTVGGSVKWYSGCGK